MTARKMISEKKFKEILQTTAFGGKGEEFYLKELKEYNLTEEQYDTLIEWLSNSHTHPYERAMAGSSIQAILTLRKRKR